MCQQTWLAMGTVSDKHIVAVVLLGLLVWAVLRWRRNTKRKQQLADGRLDERQIYQRRMSHHSAMLFGSMGSDWSRIHKEYPPAMPSRPPMCALAPSDNTLKRANSERRNLVRNSILDEKHRRRVPNPAEESFFMDTDAESPATPVAHDLHPSTFLQRYNTAESLQETHEFSAPSRPDSPSASKSHFSWATKSAVSDNDHSMRSSLQSEPVRFRTVNSWVSYQASRHRDGKPLTVDTSAAVAPKRSTVVASTPATPAVFRYHPGELVSFQQNNHRRMESADIDRQIMSPGQLLPPTIMIEEDREPAL